MDKNLELFEKQYSRQVEWVKKDMERGDYFHHLASITKATAQGMLLAAHALGAISLDLFMEEMDNLKEITEREEENGQGNAGTIPE